MYHMHIIDSSGDRDTHLIPGEGKIPLREMLYELRELPYTGTATIELVTAYINEPRFYAKRAIDAVRELMKP
jgi:protein FrlC